MHCASKCQVVQMFWNVHRHRKFDKIDQMNEPILENTYSIHYITLNSRLRCCKTQNREEAITQKWPNESGNI